MSKYYGACYDDDILEYLLSLLAKVLNPLKNL